MGHWKGLICNRGQGRLGGETCYKGGFKELGSLKHAYHAYLAACNEYVVWDGVESTGL